MHWVLIRNIHLPNVTLLTDATEVRGATMFVSHVITYIGSTLDLCWSKTVAKNSSRLLSILWQWLCCSCWACWFTVAPIVHAFCVWFVFCNAVLCVLSSFVIISKGEARTLKKLRTSKRDYFIKQWFSTITSLFKMGTSLKEKNLLPEGANSFL